MALDVGERRIGVAVSDETNIIAIGLGAIERKTPAYTLETIKALINQYEIGKVVVGLPLTMKGEKSIQAQKASGFIDALQQDIDIPVVSFDERLSTRQGERLLIEADVSRRKRKKVIDKMAAQIILQTYMESEKNAQNNQIK